MMIRTEDILATVTDDVKLAIEVGGFVITVGIIVWRLSSATTKFEIIGQQQATEITEIKNAITKMESIVSIVAVEKVRLDNQGERLNAIERRMDERIMAVERRCDGLAHGEGFVTGKHSTALVAR